jgi:hypothetical protein
VPWADLTAVGALATLVGASGTASHTREALFCLGGGALLLFVGIHNAWDSIAYHVLVNLPRDRT